MFLKSALTLKEFKVKIFNFFCILSLHLQDLTLIRVHVNNTSQCFRTRYFLKIRYLKKLVISMVNTSDINMMSYIWYVWYVNMICMGSYREQVVLYLLLVSSISSVEKNQLTVKMKCSIFRIIYLLSRNHCKE